MLTFQELILRLERFWADNGCIIWQPFSEKVGAGTMNPATVLRVLGPDTWNVAYVEPSFRPDDGRFGENPNHQILQTPTDLVVLHEMFNQRRIIPIDGRPQTGIPQWNGEPRGWWEGSTLVVESRYFPDRPHDRFRHTWRAPSAKLHVVERFKRVDAETIDYEGTITDPTRFAQPWTVRFPLSTDQTGRGVTAGHLFEFACHEGNYAIGNVLRGARVQDPHTPVR